MVEAMFHAHLPVERALNKSAKIPFLFWNELSMPSFSSFYCIHCVCHETVCSRAAAGVSAPLDGLRVMKLEHHHVDIIIGVALSHMRSRSCSTVTLAIASGDTPKLCIDSGSASRQTAA